MRVLFSPIQLLVLAALLRCPLHNYALCQSVDQLTERSLDPSKNTVKRALLSLLKAGYVEECRSGSYWVGKRVGIPYELTNSGRHAIESELIMYLEIISTAKLWIQQYEAFGPEKLPSYRQSRLAQIPLSELKFNSDEADY